MTRTEGLVGLPSVLWFNPNGVQISSSEDIVLNNPVTSDQTTNRTLYFDPIRTADGGSYTCMATLSSPALNSPLTSSAVYAIDVQQSKLIW